MCDNVIINRGEIELQTAGEFKKHFNIEEFIKDSVDDVIDEDCCLCQVDIEGELDKRGIPWVSDHVDYFVGDDLEGIIKEIQKEGLIVKSSKNIK